MLVICLPVQLIMICKLAHFELSENNRTFLRIERFEINMVCHADCHVLFQVTKLIEESTVSKTVKNAIDTDRLLDWLVENSVLSIALEGQLLCLFHIAQKLARSTGQKMQSLDSKDIHLQSFDTFVYFKKESKWNFKKKKN